MDETDGLKVGLEAITEPECKPLGAIFFRVSVTRDCGS